MIQFSCLAGRGMSLAAILRRAFQSISSIAASPLLCCGLAGVASTSGLTKWPRRSRAIRKPWSTSCWNASTTVPRATPSFSASIRQDGSGMEAAIWRSRMAATIACLICAWRVWPDSAEMRKSPDQIAESFRCGIGASPEFLAFAGTIEYCFWSNQLLH